jgi:hypothetical protein
VALSVGHRHVDLVRRTTSQPVRTVKVHQPRKAAQMFPRPSGKPAITFGYGHRLPPAVRVERFVDRHPGTRPKTPRQMAICFMPLG